MTAMAFEAAADEWEAADAPPRWATPGELACAVDPSTVQTPALGLIDEALVWAHTTRGARLVISIAPQEGKSTRVSRAGCLWALIRNPETRIGIASYAQPLAEGFGRDIRNWITTFNGDDDTVDLGLRIAPDYGSAKRWQLDGHRGGVVCVGIGSGFTGRPAECFVGSTEVLTDSGYIRIRDIYQSRLPARVLSWNHAGQRAEWKPVVAARRVADREVVEVLTAAGRRFTCTPDHPVYVEGRGYVPAAELRAGDRLVAAPASPGAVQRMRHRVHETPLRPGQGEARGAALVLEGLSVRLSQGRADVRGLRDAVRAAALRDREGGPEGLRPVVLLEGLLPGGGEQASRRAATLRYMRQAEAPEERARGGAVLLGRVPWAVLRLGRQLRALPVDVRAAALRAGEEAPRWPQGVLLAPVRLGRPRGADDSSLRRMRHADPALERPEVLHAGVPGGEPDPGAAPARSGMHGVRRRVPAEEQPDRILLEGVRRLGALLPDGRSGQLPLQDGDELRGLVPQDAPAGHRARRPRVRRLPQGPAAYLVHAQRPPGSAELAPGAPRRRGTGEQPAGEPGNPVQGMPPGPPQVGCDAVSVVRRLRGERHDVYDIQVAGNRNFFAGEVLVHNCLVIDDPFADKEQADSAYQRERVWGWWQSVAIPRLAPGAPVILVNTRWHEDDLAGRLVKADDGHRWRVLNIPAIADHKPELGQSDMLGREPGQWLESARGRTAAEWEQIRISVGSRVFTALYQGRPSPDQGNVWQRQWWRRYYEPPWSQHPDYPEAYRVAECDEMVMSWDMTFKDTKSSDYVAGQVWMRRGADVFLLDQVCKRLSFTDTLIAFAAMAARWPQASRRLVEDKANGPAVISSLRSKIPGIVAITPKDSKYARATAVSPFIEAGNAFLPDPEIALFDAEALISQAAAFPNDAHDDMVDAASQALAEMLLDGNGAQAWIAWAKRKAEQAAAGLAEAPPPAKPARLPAGDPYGKCLKPDCMRKVKPGVAYCCTSCATAAQAPAPYEVAPYDPVSHWVLVHSADCEARSADRGDLTPAGADVLTDEQRRRAARNEMFRQQQRA